MSIVRAPVVGRISGADLARWYRPVCLGLAVLFAAAAIAVGVVRYQAFAARDLVGIDREHYAGLGQRWLQTGSIYLPYQLAGPFPAGEETDGRPDLRQTPGLYPPVAAPFLVLAGFMPALLWWLIPLMGIGWGLRKSAPWSWPILALACSLPQVASGLIVGNTSMWMAAAVTWGARLGWPVALVLLKPTLAPFALLGIRRRAFWYAVTVLAVMAVAMLPEWSRYFAVIRNVEGSGLAYSLGDFPLLVAVALAGLRPHAPHAERDADEVRRRAEGSASVVP